MSNPPKSLPLDSSLGLELLSSGPDCVKIIDAQGRLQFINKVGVRLLEIDDAESLNGEVWSKLWPAASQSLVENALAEARAGKEARFTGECPTAKGTPRWWDVFVTPIRSASNAGDWILAVSRDITQHKAIEDSLRFGERRFRALADNVAQLAWMADATGYAFWFNKRWFDYTGANLDALAGTGWQKMIHPGHVDRVTRKMHDSLATGEAWEETFPLLGTDGTHRWFLTSARPIRDERGEMALWCATSTDITEQRTASQRLRQKARLIELSHEAIMVWDLEQGIVLWNKGCEELYGYTQKEALGAVSHDLLRTWRQMPREAFEAELKEKGYFSGEIRHVAKDGSEVWVDSRQELGNIGGRDVVFETNRDITERRRADEIRDLLIGELNHRVRNTLAIVQAIATQTARSAASPHNFVGSFNGRVHSLACAHNVLTDAHWRGAGVRELVTSQLALTVGDLPNSVVLSGDNVFLPPQTALQFTLILHELATNASKFGALSYPGGRLEISWKVQSDGQPKLDFTWRESGGPRVSQPSVRGFGLTLIERSSSLPHLNARLEFDPTGVVCRISADLTDAGALAPALFNPGRRMMPN